MSKVQQQISLKDFIGRLKLYALTFFHLLRSAHI